MRTFAEHTTVRVGGPARHWVVARTEQQAVEELARHPLPSDEQRRDGQDTLLVLGGGSNLIVSDAGFGGTVLQLAWTGIETQNTSDDVLVTIAAGHQWDQVVSFAVSCGLAGVETLAGIPGGAGATPVQNVGAYGTEIAQTLVDVRAYDRVTGEIETLSAADLDFSYRDSLLKRSTLAGSPQYVVLSIRLRLAVSELSVPVRYRELVRRLALPEGGDDEQRRAPLAAVRDAVVDLRAGKGMVLDAADHDTWSTGSFFTNPIVVASAVAEVPAEAPRFPAGESRDGEPLVKLSAAWLIENAGCGKGFGLLDGPLDGRGLVEGRAALSTKHTLAVTNRGAASAADLLCVARAARDRVHQEFGVQLHPEPVLIGADL